MSRIRADQILNGAGTGAPNFSLGLQVGAATTVHTTGIDLGSGNIQSHNINSTGIITAQSGVNVTGGTVTVGADPNDGANAGAKMTTTGVIQAARASGSAASAVFMGFLEGDTSANFRVNANGSGYLMGNVGIGTDDPNYRFVVGGSNQAVMIREGAGTLAEMTNTTAQRLGFQGGNAELGLFKDSNGDYKYILGSWQGSIPIPLVFRTGNRIERMRITFGGNVGIGLTNPNRKLVISQANSTAYSGTDFDQDYHVLKLNNSTDSKTVGMQFLIGSNGEAAITATETSDGATDLIFGTRGSGSRAERLRITSAGDVTMRGTDSQYLEMASFKTTNGATLVSNNGGFLSFTPIENTNSSVIVHSTSTNPTRITFPVAGVVHVNFHQDIRSGNATTSSHYDYIRFDKNGSTVLNSLITSTSGLWGNIHGTATIEVASNDYIELRLLTNTSISSWDDTNWSSYNFIFAPINTNS